MSWGFTAFYLSWKWKKMQNWRRNWLVISKLAWGICQNLTRALKNLKICTLMGFFWPKYIIFELKKLQRSYIWWHLGLMQNLKEDWFVLSKMPWRICQFFFHRLKNSNFILGSKMAKLNQNKYRPDWSDVVWTLCFNLDINE